MKNILLLISFIITGIVLFSSCNPTKEFTDEYNKYNDPSKIKFADTVTVYTLTTTDYTYSSVANISGYKNFSDVNPANPNLLEILNKKYNAKIGATVKIGYAYNNPLPLHDTTSYTLVNADYGNTYYDYTKVTDLYTYLGKTYPTATRGKVAILTYNWLTKTGVVTNTFFYLGNSTWIIVTPLVLADYTALGQGNYADFTNTTDPLYNIPIFLKGKYPYAKTGDNYMYQYAVYASSKMTQYVLQFTFNGSVWLPFNPLSTTSISANFDGTQWKFLPKEIFFTGTPPADAIAYTLIADDYKLVNGSSAYSDFDRRVGYPENTDVAFLSKMGTILRARFTIVLGQIYAVTYADYAGTNPPPAKTVYLQVVPN